MADETTDQTGERTEQPTPFRLAEARRRGQVPRSADLTAAAAGLAALGVLAWAAPGLLRSLTSMVAALLDGRAMSLDPARADLAGQAWRAAGSAVWTSAAVLGGVAALIGLAGFAQVGPLYAPARVEADWQRISLAEGWRRLFSSRSAVRAAFTLAKVVGVVLATWLSARPMAAAIVSSAHLDAGSIAALAGGLAATLMFRVGLVLLVLGAAEWAYQRWQHRHDLRMTRRQWHDDMKRADGDGNIRRRRQQLGRHLGDWRVASEAAGATMVLVDGRGSAVAVCYAPGQAEPDVTASGQGLLGLRIRQAAEAAGVPVIPAAAVVRELQDRGRTGEPLDARLTATLAGLRAAAGEAGWNKVDKGHG